MRKFGKVALLLSAAAAAGAVWAADGKVPVKAATAQAAEGAAQAVAKPVLDKRATALVEKFCSGCHNDFQAEGDRSFDAFLADPHSDKFHHSIVEMLDEINRGAMPKKEKGVAPPTDDERRYMVAALTGYLDAVAASTAPEETTLRRLSNVEYANTLHDLLGVEPGVIDAVSSFTPDANVHGLINLSQAQNLSRQQMEGYILAAQQGLDRVFALAKQPDVKPTRLVITPRELLEGEGAVQITRQTWAQVGGGNKYLDIGYGRVEGDRPVFPYSYMKQGGVPADGVYAIRVEAEAINRFNDYDAKKIGVNVTKEPLKLAIGVAPNVEATKVVDAPLRTTLGVFDVADNKRGWFEYRAPLHKGNLPFVFWPNGVRGSAYITRVISNYKPELSKYIREADKGTFVAFGRKGVPEDLSNFMLNEFKGPRIRVHSIEIVGPFSNDVPGAFTRADFRRFLATPANKMDSVFVEFASRAFRRSVTEKDIKPYLALAQKRLAAGGTQEDALKLGLAAIMSSPRFIYLDEGNADAGHELDHYEVASRLSYFLWSTMPDKTLLDLAAAGQLRNPAILREQVKRMLQDKKASSFVSGFTNAWLRLDKLGSMPPDSKVYGVYFNDRLEEAMRNQTRLFFSDILLSNRPTRDFLTSDFTYLNGSLARFYDIPGIDGETFQRVTLPEGSPRRGLVGHASVLTASANGIDTSPVVRGVWVLENLLGTPPPPPPPDVPAIEPDARGATTIRELLDKHRSNQSCADCHAKIDPYGFPLEVFGPIGEIRQRYPAMVDGNLRLNRGATVDASTVLPNGEALPGFKEFQAHLLQRKPDFDKHLVEKLLTYATGREPTFRDRADVEGILAKQKSDNAGFQDMVIAVAMSKQFLSR